MKWNEKWTSDVVCLYFKQRQTSSAWALNCSSGLSSILSIPGFGLWSRFALKWFYKRWFALRWIFTEVDLQWSGFAPKWICTEMDLHWNGFAPACCWCLTLAAPSPSLKDGQSPLQARAAGTDNIDQLHGHKDWLQGVAASWVVKGRPDLEEQKAEQTGEQVEDPVQVFKDDLLSRLSSARDNIYINVYSCKTIYIFVLRYKRPRCMTFVL